jgi:hypothetical protein
MISYAQDWVRKYSRVRTKRKNGFSFEFLKRYYKDDDEFLSHNVRVTGDETWVPFVNVETKEQSM